MWHLLFVIDTKYKTKRTLLYVVYNICSGNPRNAFSFGSRYLQVFRLIFFLLNLVSLSLKERKGFLISFHHFWRGHMGTLFCPILVAYLPIYALFFHRYKTWSHSISVIFTTGLVNYNRANSKNEPTVAFEFLYAFLPRSLLRRVT